MVTKSDAVLDLVRKAQDAPDAAGTVTVPELARLMECGEPKARRIMKELLIEGKVEPCRVKRRDPWGILRPVPGYRVK